MFASQKVCKRVGRSGHAEHSVARKFIIVLHAMLCGGNMFQVKNIQKFINLIKG